MSGTNNETHLSIVNNSLQSQNVGQSHLRNLTHPCGINPALHLEEARQQRRINKFIALQESLTTMARTSFSVDTEQESLSQIADTIEQLKTTRSILSALKDSDIEGATQFGRDLMITTTDLLLRVVKQIGQKNVQTPTFESIIAYIRGLMHTRSAHMRHTIPGPLLIAWYELSRLMSSMQNEPELRITNAKAKQLLDVTQNTAAWAYKHLSTKYSNTDNIGFIDRSSTPCTYE